MSDLAARCPICAWLASRLSILAATLHVINSSIVKLSKLTFAAKVYRGVSGGRLPYNFRVANGYGVRGGVDPAFMSTTTDREVSFP